MTQLSDECCSRLQVKRCPSPKNRNGSDINTITDTERNRIGDQGTDPAIETTTRETVNTADITEDGAHTVTPFQDQDQDHHLADQDGLPSPSIEGDEDRFRLRDEIDRDLHIEATVPVKIFGKCRVGTLPHEQHSHLLARRLRRTLV